MFHLMSFWKQLCSFPQKSKWWSWPIGLQETGFGFSSRSRTAGTATTYCLQTKKSTHAVVIHCIWHKWTTTPNVMKTSLNLLLLTKKTYCFYHSRQYRLTYGPANTWSIRIQLKKTYCVHVHVWILGPMTEWCTPLETTSLKITDLKIHPPVSHTDTHSSCNPSIWFPVIPEVKHL